MILLTSYFHDAKRKHEFDLALKRNIENNYIHKILLFLESGDPPISEKVEVIEYDRPTYKDFFEFIEEGQVNIIANTDIYFNDTVAIMERVGDGECFAITRHEYESPMSYKAFESKHEWSQDVWALRKKPRDLTQFEEVLAVNTSTGRCDYIPFYLGVAGCDNHVAYLLSKQFRIVNPCHDIHCIHVHKDTDRDYKVKYRITGKKNSHFGYLKQVPPTRL